MKNSQRMSAFQRKEPAQGKGAWPVHGGKEKLEIIERLERLRITFTANGKRQK